MENKIMAKLKLKCLINFFGAMWWTPNISDYANTDKNIFIVIWSQLAMYTVSSGAYHELSICKTKF